MARVLARAARLARLVRFVRLLGVSEVNLTKHLKCLVILGTAVSISCATDPCDDGGGFGSRARDFCSQFHGQDCSKHSFVEGAYGENCELSHDATPTCAAVGLLCQ